jgi:hypothetical protein
MKNGGPKSSDAKEVKRQRATSGCVDSGICAPSPVLAIKDHVACAPGLIPVLCDHQHPSLQGGTVCGIRGKYWGCVDQGSASNTTTLQSELANES